MKNLPQTARKSSSDLYLVDDVTVYIDALTDKEQAKVLRKFDWLLDAGLGLGEPHIKYLGKGLYELRVDINKKFHRFLFFPHSQSFIVVVAFAKKTNKTPEHFKRLAEQRRRETENTKFGSTGKPKSQPGRK